MSKRGHGAINGGGDSEGSRHKRRREVGGSSSDVDVMTSDPIEPSVVNGVGFEWKEQALKLWQTVKDAVKDDKSLSLPFLRKPSKRLYPDYYVLIKQPIALDDIKRQIDHGEYSSLEAVKDDLELIFANAKQYNQTESEIFQDAKELLKLVHKTYNKMVPNEDEGENGKHKAPNLTRLMRSRLEKLVNKTDSQGRVLSNEFMQLPSKKEWPIYYKDIKKPQCFDAIFKHIKRKEYHTAATFAADVELVFSNALQFNQEHTQIWDDAMTLRDHFRQLMSDMPPPHALPEYTKPSNKIKIKPRQNSQPVASGSSHAAPKQEQSGTSSFLLRVPAAQKAAAQAPTTSPMPAPTVPAPTAKKQAPAPVPVAKAPPPQPPAPSKVATPQPGVQTVSFINATPSHYPRAPYVPPAPAAASPAPVVATPNFPATGNATSASHSPTPVILPLNHQLKSITLRMQPKGRTLTLDHRDGVKNWAMRLGPGETSILVSNISFLGDEEEEESSGDEGEGEKHEDDDDMDVDVDVDVSPPSKNGRRRNKPRGRGRPPKAATLAAKAAAAAKAAKAEKKKAISKVGEIQLKLNNFVVKEQPEEHGEWSVQLPAGPNIIEIGEVGGMVWKVYAERLGDV